MDLQYTRNETWISMELESSDRNWTIRLPKGGKDWRKLDREFLYCVSVADVISLVCKRGKNKDCFGNKQYFFSNLSFISKRAALSSGSAVFVNPY